MFEVFAIATRRSPLAVAQTQIVQKALAAAAGVNLDKVDEVFPLATFVTEGDRNLVGSLADVGGKGLFTKEIESALIARTARFAIHSLKDMPVVSPPGLVVAAIPAREDPRDCFISEIAPTIEALPDGAAIGAASVRRIAQARALRPDLRSVVLRGNVQTRLEKLRRGDADATFLALAGLNRLGAASAATKILTPDEMLPAPGQGALCVQARADDEAALALAAQIHCRATAAAVAVERAFLAGLDGSCRTPIAAYAAQAGEKLKFRGALYSLDGAEQYFAEAEIDAHADEDALVALGAKAATDVRASAGQAFFDKLTGA